MENTYPRIRCILTTARTGECEPKMLEWFVHFHFQCEHLLETLAIELEHLLLPTNFSPRYCCACFKWMNVTLQQMLHRQAFSHLVCEFHYPIWGGFYVQHTLIHTKILWVHIVYNIFCSSLAFCCYFGCCLSILSTFHLSHCMCSALLYLWVALQFYVYIVWTDIYRAPCTLYNIHFSCVFSPARSLLPHSGPNIATYGSVLWASVWLCVKTTLVRAWISHFHINNVYY